MKKHTITQEKISKPRVQIKNTNDINTELIHN